MQAEDLRNKIFTIDMIDLKGDSEQETKQMFYQIKK